MTVVSVSINVDMSGVLENLDPDKIAQAKSKGLAYATAETIRVLQRNSPVDHGLLKMWFIESITDSEAHIRTPAEYAVYVNDGTEPYVIEPVNKKALYWEGLDHPVKRVNHPGIKGQHFVEDSIDDVDGRLDGYFLQALSEVLG